MLTCLEIVNIIYMKCIEMCDEIKQKYNSTFSLEIKEKTIITATTTLYITILTIVRTQ